MRLTHIQFSLVFLFGVLTGLLIAYQGLRMWHALIAALFGFYLAKSAAAPTVTDTVNSIIGHFTGHK